MTDLIVDFPYAQQRRDSFAYTKNLAVRFSTTSKLTFVERHSESDSTNMWYTGDDIDSMKAEFRRDVQDTHYRLYSGISSLESDDDSTGSESSDIVQVELFGMEGMLTPKLVKKKHESRSQCWRAVLVEQARQQKENEYDPRRLAKIARYHSRWSVRRAHTIGLLQNRYSS